MKQSLLFFLLFIVFSLMFLPLYLVDILFSKPSPSLVAPPHPKTFGGAHSFQREGVFGYPAQASREILHCPPCPSTQPGPCLTPAQLPSNCTVQRHFTNLHRPSRGPVQPRVLFSSQARHIILTLVLVLISLHPHSPSCHAFSHSFSRRALLS